MRPFLFRRWTAVLLLTLLAALTPGLAMAGPHRPAPRQPSPVKVLSLLGDWLRTLLAKNGAEVDPSGAPRSVSVAPTPPPRPASTTENGAEVDPNGRS